MVVQLEEKEYPLIFMDPPYPAATRVETGRGALQASFTLRKCTPEYPLSLGPGAAGYARGAG